MPGWRRRAPRRCRDCEMTGRQEVVHDQDATGDQRVETGVEAGEAVKTPCLLGHQLDTERRIPLKEIDHGLDFGVGREGDPVEGEIPPDQFEKLWPVFSFGGTDNHRASLASL